MVIRTFDVCIGDELVFRGTTNEVQKKFGGEVSNLMYYVKNNSLWRKIYTIKVYKEQGAADLNQWHVMENGKVIFTGTDREIADHFGLGRKFRGSIYWKKNYRIHKRYAVMPYRKDKTESEEDEEYINMLAMFKQYHNYYVHDQPEKAAERLAKDGINVEIRDTADKDGYVLWQI